MAVVAEVPQPEPAAIATAGIGTEVSLSVHRAGAAVCRGHRLRWHRRGQLGMRRLVLTQGAVGLMGEACKRLRLRGALPPRHEGLGWRSQIPPDLVVKT